MIEKERRQGTTVNNKPHANRWKAIRSAVGLLAADSFLIGDSCLVVEGVSDHIYIAGLSRLLAQLGEPHLDLNETALIPAPSASETVAPARFCQAERIPVVVLLDGDNQGNQAEASLLRDRYIRPEQIVRIEQPTPGPARKTRAIEDLLPPDIFLAALNAACSNHIKGFSPLTSAEVASAQKPLQGASIPIVNAIQKIFSEKKYGDLDKRLVAEQFINDLPDPDDLSEEEQDQLTKRFSEVGKLFEIITTRLREATRWEGR